MKISADGPSRSGSGDGDGSKKASFTYTAERVLGSGSFGIVYQAQVVETGESVAIKKVFQDKRYKNRELQIMKELRHPNVVQLKHAFYTSGEKPGETYLNVVMEYCSDTVDYISKLLVYDPKMRPSGLQCCTHSLFDDLRNQQTRISPSKPLPDHLFVFAREERALMDGSLEEKLIPAWWRESEGKGLRSRSKTPEVVAP